MFFRKLLKMMAVVTASPCQTMQKLRKDTKPRKKLEEANKVAALITAQCIAKAKKPTTNPAIVRFVEWIWCPRRKLLAVRSLNSLVRCTQKWFKMVPDPALYVEWISCQ